MVNLDYAAIEDIVPLGYKNHHRGSEAFSFSNLLPALATTPGGEEIQLGGFSGLWFEGIDPTTGNYKFVPVPDATTATKKPLQIIVY